MKLDLRLLEEFPAAVELVAGPTEIAPFSDEVLGVESVKLALTVVKSEEEYYCHGTMRARVKLECMRCLDPFEAERSEEVDFVICSESHAAQMRKEGVDNEEYVLLTGGDTIVEVNEPVRQALLLSLELKPLCKEDCKGLCSVCGANKNHVDCGHVVAQVDDRWQALADLVQKQRKELR